MTQFFFPLIRVVDSVRKTTLKFLDLENILKPLFFRSKCFKILSCRNCPRDRTAKMKSLCLINILSEEFSLTTFRIARHDQTKQCGSKMSFKSLAHSKPRAREIRRRLRDSDVIKHCDVTSTIIVPRFPGYFYMETGGSSVAKKSSK